MYNNITGLQKKDMILVPTEMINSSYRKRRARGMKSKGRTKFVNILTKTQSHEVYINQ
jgi:hypothetical protein